MRIPLLCLALVLPGLITWLYFFGPLPTAAAKGVYGGSKVLFLLLPILWTLYVARERIRIPRPTRAALIEGTASGILIGAAMIAVFAFFVKGSPLLEGADVAARERLAGFGIATPLTFLGLSAFVILQNSVLEEYYWRGFLFRRLEERLPWIAAALITGAGFTLHHIVVLADYLPPTGNALASFGVGVGGFIWAWQTHRAGIWAAIVSHAVVDAALFAIAFDLLFRG